MSGKEQVCSLTTREACPCRCNPDPCGGQETASPYGERLVIKRRSAREKRRYASSRRKPRAKQVTRGNASEDTLRRRHEEPAKRLITGRPKRGRLCGGVAQLIHRTTRKIARRKVSLLRLRSGQALKSRQMDVRNGATLNGSRQSRPPAICR